MCLCVSSIPDAGFGVCTRKHISAGTWIGPFEGKRVRPDDVKPGADMSYMWEVGGDFFSLYFRFLYERACTQTSPSLVTAVTIYPQYLI